MRHFGLRRRNGADHAKAVARAFDVELHTRRALAVHHTHGQRLLELVVGGAHAAALPVQRYVGTLQLCGDGGGLCRAGLRNGLGQCLHHQVHAHVHVVVGRLGIAHAERLVERLALSGLHVGQPVGHGHDLADAGFTNGSRRAQRVAVERVELAFEARLARGLDQQRQVVAEVAGDDRIGTAGLDLGGVRCKVLDAKQRVQLSLQLFG